MYTDKIQEIEKEINNIKNNIKANRKEINKRRKILSMVDDEDLEIERLEYVEEIEHLKILLQTKKKILKNYKKL